MKKRTNAELAEDLSRTAHRESLYCIALHDQLRGVKPDAEYEIPAEDGPESGGVAKLYRARSATGGYVIFAWNWDPKKAFDCLYLDEIESPVGTPTWYAVENLKHARERIYAGER